MRIVIVEDHLLFSDVLRKVCVQDLRHTVVGVARDGRSAVGLITTLRPELVLLDLQLPQLDGFGVVEAIRRQFPRMRIIVVSSHCDAYTVFRAEKTGVQGFVDKNTSTLETIAQAIANLAEGRTYFSEAFLELKAARHGNPASFDKVLTDREREVLSLLGQPMSDPEVAARLGISAGTVEKHRFNILAKLGLASTLELVRYAQEHGFTLSALPGRAGRLLP